MTIWKPPIGKCLQCMKDPSNGVDNNAVAVVHTNSHCKKGDWSCTTEISMIVFLFLSLRHCALEIFPNGKRDNHGG